MFADADEDGCATRDEMTALYEEAINIVDAGDTLGYLEAVFNSGDLNGDDLMTWSEINQAIPGIVANGVMSETRTNAILGLFQVFDIQ